MRSLTLALILFIVATPLRAGGVPTMDAGQIAALAAQLQQLKEQFDLIRQQYMTIKEQYTLIKEEYDKLREITEQARMFVNMVKNFHDYLPKSLTDIDALLTDGGGIREIAEAAHDLREEMEAYSPEAIYGPGTNSAKEEYKRDGDRLYSYLGVLEHAYKRAAERSKALDGFREALGHADTPKKVLDLNTRIAAENTQIMNDILRSQILRSQMEMVQYNDKRNRQAREIATITKPGDIKYNR